MPTQKGPESSEGCPHVLKTVSASKRNVTPLFYLCDTPAEKKWPSQLIDQDEFVGTSTHQRVANWISGTSEVVGRRVGGPGRSSDSRRATKEPGAFRKAQGIFAPLARSHLTVARSVLVGQAMAHSIARKRFGGGWERNGRLDRTHSLSRGRKPK